MVGVNDDVVMLEPLIPQEVEGRLVLPRARESEGRLEDGASAVASGATRRTPVEATSLGTSSSESRDDSTCCGSIWAHSSARSSLRLASFVLCLPAANLALAFLFSSSSFASA